MEVLRLELTLQARVFIIGSLLQPSICTIPQAWGLQAFEFVQTVKMVQGTLRHVIQVLKGQLLHTGESQVIQKLSGGGKKRGAAHRFFVANDLDPTAVFQLFDDQGVDRNASNVLHFPAGDGLAVRNDGQGLQHGSAVFGRLFGVQTVQIDAHVWATLKTPALGDLHQFNALVRPLQLQLL